MSAHTAGRLLGLCLVLYVITLAAVFWFGYDGRRELVDAQRVQCHTTAYLRVANINNLRSDVLGLRGDIAVLQALAPRTPAVVTDLGLKRQSISQKLTEIWVADRVIDPPARSGLRDPRDRRAADTPFSCEGAYPAAALF